MLSLLCTTLCIALAQPAQAPAPQPAVQPTGQLVGQAASQNAGQSADQLKPDQTSANAAERYLSLLDRLGSKLPELASAVEFDPREFRLYNDLWRPITVEEVQDALIANEAWIQELRSVAAMERFELIVPRYVLGRPDEEQAESFVESFMRPHASDFLRILHAHAAYKISAGDVDEAADSLIAILDLACDFATVEDGLGVWEMRSQAYIDVALDAINSLLNDTIASIRLSGEGRRRLIAAIACLDAQDPAGIFRHWKKESSRLLAFAECELANDEVGEPLLSHLLNTHDMIARMNRAKIQAPLSLPSDDATVSMARTIARTQFYEGGEKALAFIRNEPTFSNASLLAATSDAAAACDEIERIWLDPEAKARIEVISNVQDSTGMRAMVLHYANIKWSQWSRVQARFEKVQEVLGMTHSARSN